MTSQTEDSVVAMIRSEAYVPTERLPESRVDALLRQIAEINDSEIYPRQRRIKEIIENCEHDFRYTTYYPVSVYEGKNYSAGDFVYVPNGIWQLANIRCMECHHEEIFGHHRCPLCLGKAEAEKVKTGEVTFYYRNFKCPRCNVRLSHEAEDWG